MKERIILEVLVVNAKDIRHTNVIGKPAYYVNIECGTQLQRSKTSRGKHREIHWNEKFTFEFPSSEWENLTHLKFKIMDEEYFSTDGGFVGETIVYIRGILVEANNAGGVLDIKPAPYNVVLEDDTYQGELKIGLKFIPNKEAKTTDGRLILVEGEEELGPSMLKKLMDLWRVPWWSFLFSSCM